MLSGSQLIRSLITQRVRPASRFLYIACDIGVNFLIGVAGITLLAGKFALQDL